MKKTISAVIAFVLLITALFVNENVSLLMSAQSDDLVINGSFENGVSGWGELYYGIGGIREARIIIDDAYVGNKSATVAAGYNNYIYTVIECKKNTNYELSFYSKNAGGLACSVVPEFSNGQIMQNGFTKNNGLLLENLGSSSEWQFSTYSFNSGEYTKLCVVFYNRWNCDGKVRFDAVSVTEIIDDNNLIGNGGFEKGTASWGEWYRGINSIKPERIIEDDAYSGNKSATVATGYNNYIYTIFECKKNTNYELSFYSKNVGGLACSVVPEFSNGQIMQNGFTKENGLLLENLSGTSEWQLNTYSFNSGEYTKLCVVFYNRWEGNGSARFDEVFVTEKAFDPEDNLIIKNHSFENGTKEWKGLSEKSDADFIVTDEESADGKYSARLKNSNYNKFYQDFLVEKNTDYVVSFKSLGKKTSWATKWGIRNTNDLNIDKGNIICGDKLSESNEWISNSVKFNSGDNEKLRLVFQSLTETLCYIDDVYVVEANSIVLNGSFENGNVAWSMPDTSFEVTNAEKYGENGYYSLHAKGGYYEKASQSILLEKNTTYKLSFRYKGIVETEIPYFGISHTVASFKESNLIVKGSIISSEEWQEKSVVFSSGNYETFSLMFQTAGNCNFYIDDVVIEKTDEIPEEYTAGVTPSFVSDSRGVRYICDTDNNLITGADFENSGNWNVPSFVGNGSLTTETVDNAISGSKVLKFSANGTEIQHNVFYVNVEPNTDYYFTAWVWGEFRSNTNKTDMTFGVIDANTGMFLPKSGDSGRTFNGTISVIPPSWDENWHLVTMEFNSGTASTMGISVWGTCSTALFDDMYLFKKEDSVEYVAAERRKISPELSSTSAEKLDCDSDKNLLENFDLSDNTNDFWQTGKIFGNTVSIKQTGGTKGNSLYYSSKTKNPSRTYYIKWINVEKDTEYTFSCNYNVMQPGELSFFGLINGNRYLPSDIMKWTLDSSAFDENYSWKTASATFNTKDYDKIGFVVFDGGGSAYIDNLRLFKSSNGKVLSVTDSFPKKITNKKYNRNGDVMSGIPLGTTVAELKEAFVEKQYIRFFKNGKEITDLSTAVATGVEVRLMDGPEIKDRFTTIIYGDVNGDGLANISDVRAILDHLTHKVELSNVYKSAADTDRDGVITINDATLISAALNGKYTIKQ